MSHIPVMLEESLQFFQGKRMRTFFDGTLGMGGFAKRLMVEHPEIERYYGCDRDEEALSLARENLGAMQDKVVFINGDFRDLDTLLALQGVEEIDSFFLILECRRCS